MIGSFVKNFPPLIKIYRIITITYYNLRYSFLRIIYQGNKHYCNLCKSHTRIFFGYGEKSDFFSEREIIGARFRENAMCPCCSSLERHRLLYDYLENHTDIFKESCSILHFAAEGNIKNKLFENTQIDYYSADIVKNRAMYQVDITKIPFPSQKFDYVLCNHVLQDIEDDRKAIMEMKRVLKSNGTIILSFPLCISQHNTYEDMEKKSFKERFETYGDKYHVRIYGLDVKQRIQSCGLHVQEYIWKDHINDRPNHMLMSIHEKDRLFVCSLSNQEMSED
jgi:SAM-dependent methyltransferase